MCYLQFCEYICVEIYICSVLHSGLGEAQSQICQLQEVLEQIRNLPIVTDSAFEVRDFIYLGTPHPPPPSCPFTDCVLYTFSDINNESEVQCCTHYKTSISDVCKSN